MRKTLLAAALLSLIGHPALAFDVRFEWGGIPSCTTGVPNAVPSPDFKLTDVPEGTTTLKFNLQDMNVGYNHGGGSVPYHGEIMIASGAFTYKSPCPPDGPHMYEWTVTAFDSKEKILATATTERQYP